MSRVLSLALASVLGIAGCALAPGSSGPDLGISGSDACFSCGAHDGAPGLEGGPPLMPSMEGFDAPTRATAMGDVRTITDLRQLYTCYDGIDNDATATMSTGADCADPGCAWLASCCTGPDFDCCDAPAAQTLPVLCASGLDVCMHAGLGAFGIPSAYSDGVSVFPGGDHLEDSGVIVGAPLDAVRATFLTARLTVPVPTCASGACLESVAVGFVPDVPYGVASTVRPVIALVASATLGTVSFVAGDVVLASVPAPGTAGMPFDVALNLSAAGLVEATVGTITLSGEVPPPSVPLRLAVWGHNENRDATMAASSAHAELLSLGQAACDFPSAWQTRGPVTIAAGATAPRAELRGPSVAYGPADAYLAFASGGAVYVAHRDLSAAMPADYAMQAGFGTPQLGAADGSTDYADPDIHRLDDTVWRLWLVNRATGSVIAADADAAAPFTYGTPQHVLGVGDDLLSTLHVTAIDGPSVLPPSPRSSDWVMALRLHFAAEASRIVLLHSPDGLGTWTLHGGSLDAATVPIPHDVTDVAHDEAASPSLVYRNGGFALYYAGRTFGRWAIDVMLSDTLDFWRRSPTAPALVPTGGPGFDAYGVADPGVADVEGDAARVELLYAATDGTRSAIGRVERPATVAWAHAAGIAP